MEPEEFVKLVKKIISDPKKLYAISLVLIILFPPINFVTRISQFKGWFFITKLGGFYHINIQYLIIEVALVKVLYYLFRKKS
jgi:hypothetical protein